MLTDNTKRSHVGWGFWLGWVLASIVGFAATFVGGAVLEVAKNGTGAWAPNHTSFHHDKLLALRVPIRRSDTN